MLYGVAMPVAGTCHLAKPRPCWTEKATGFQYKDKDLTPEGAAQLTLKEGLEAGKASIAFSGIPSIFPPRDARSRRVCTPRSDVDMPVLK